jgi:quercetin dioxygenase-like cupin family protein
MTRSFYTLDAYVETEIRPSLNAAVIDGQQATAVRWVFAPDMPRTGIHHHDDHEQFGVVLSGHIELEIGGVVSRLGPGEMYYAPKGVPHGGTIVLGNAPAIVLDFFSPPREEYVRAANGGPTFDPVANK